MKTAQLIEQIPHISTFKKFGRVTRVVGLMIESQGPDSSIGDVCKIHVETSKKWSSNYTSRGGWF